MNEYPRNVKDLLIEAKDASELMVDLAYTAVFFDDEAIAEEVLRLEERMNEYVHKMRILSMLAARSVDDAEEMAGVLQVTSAIERIGDSAEDVARVVLRDLGIPAELLADLSQAEEVVSRMRVREGSAMEGYTLRELALPTRTGMRLIAIRRGLDWTYGPGGDEVIAANDVLFAQGPPEGVNLLRELAGVPLKEAKPAAPAGGLTKLDRAVDLIVEMKNLSEVAVGLAYAALLFREKSVAAEVGVLEDRMDEMRYELEKWVLLSAKETEDPERLLGLLHLATASENICDAAKEMAVIIEEDVQLHPVLAAALSQTDEVIIRATVRPGSEMMGNTLGGLPLETETGMYVLAVRRGERWIYRPKADFMLLENDVLLASGPEEGGAALLRLCGEGEEEDS